MSDIIERLLAPIQPTMPTGLNPRNDPGSSRIYYQLKDARSAARLTERQADAESERAALAPEWRMVSELAQTILTNIGKDIEVAVWFTEAAIRLDGFAGLCAGFALLDGLTERYWPDLHSLDADDVSGKVAPITGLNGSGAEGALIQPIRLAPFTQPGSGEPAGLWHFMMMRRYGPGSPDAVVLANAVRGSSPAALRRIFQDITQALAHHTALAARLDALCGDETPPSSAIRNVIGEVVDAMRDIAGDALADPPLEQRAEEEISAVGAPAENAPPAKMGPQPLRTRDDALRELSRVAAFFREHEPNAPTAYTIETLIRRAQIPLVDLLAELIPDEANRQLYLDRAGIRPDMAGR